MVFALRSLFLPVLLALSAPAVWAQINTGEIAGVARDASGAVLPGATVTGTHVATGAVVERITDGEGRFFLPALRIGTWNVEARFEGLSPQTHQVVLEVGRTRHRRIQRWACKVSPSSIEVQRPLPLLQVTTAEISDVIENREVVGLPLNGRNFLALAQLSDAVVIPPGGTRGEALQQAGPIAQCRWATVGSQHLPARRHQGDRRVVQQPRHQPIGRFDRRVQDPQVDVRGRIRRQGVRAHQRGHSCRREYVSRHCL